MHSLPREKSILTTAALIFSMLIPSVVLFLVMVSERISPPSPHHLCIFIGQRLSLLILVNSNHHTHFRIRHLFPPGNFYCRSPLSQCNLQPTPKRHLPIHLFGHSFCILAATQIHKYVMVVSRFPIRKLRGRFHFRHSLDIKVFEQPPKLDV